MNKYLKVLISAVIILVMGYIAYGVLHAFMGNYAANASFLATGLLLICTAFILWLIGKCLKHIWTLFLILSIGTIQSCNYAKSNQQVVTSDDCGMTWKKVNAGDAVPKGVANPCYMKVVMPNFPMQGDSKFICNLKDRVRANVHIDYDYSITDPLPFIKQAKYLGKANSEPDESGALNPSAFEGAENMVIDKRIKDVGKGLFLLEDIVELDQADLENKLQNESNKVLEPLGVKLNFITLTFDLDEQTRQAIDIATAVKIYESKGITEVGKQIMVARAGATKVTVENKTESVPKSE